MRGDMQTLAVHAGASDGLSGIAHQRLGIILAELKLRAVSPATTPGKHNFA